jgi:hypothetical protein
MIHRATFNNVTGFATFVVKSDLSGKETTFTAPVTIQEFDSWAHRGALIQRAMPCLNDEQRELLKTGITATEWKAIFGN